MVAGGGDPSDPQQRRRPGPRPRDRVRLHDGGRHPAPRRRLRAPARGGLVRRRRHPRRTAPILTGQQGDPRVVRAPARPVLVFRKEVMRGLSRSEDQRQDQVSTGSSGRGRRGADRGGRHPGRSETGSGARPGSRRGRAAGRSAGVQDHGLRQVQVRTRHPPEGGPQEAVADRGSRRSSSAPRSTRTTTPRRRAMSAVPRGQGTRSRSRSCSAGARWRTRISVARSWTVWSRTSVNSSIVEAMPKQEGRNMIMVIGPTSGNSRAGEATSASSRAAKQATGR